VTPVSQLLREATQAQHRQAEDSGFMRALAAGTLDVPAYAALAGQLWFVYDALETAGEALRGDDVVGAFVDPRLDRRAALRGDLDVLLGPGWEAGLRPLPPTRAYADRIHAAAGEYPPAYLGHHYTRYLGDLSGGQILARVLARDYGMTGGLAFFDFPQIPKRKVYKDEYRARLDALTLDEQGCRRVVREAQRAFDLNTALFDALGTRHLPRAS
jgi:heme oxygenase